jgi:hypothetical protein
MSTWKELHDDFQQEALLYVEDLKITPQQVMRYLTKGMSEFQRLTAMVKTEKSVTGTPVGTPPTINDPAAPYAVGSDIVEIHTVIDTDGNTLLSTSWKQFQDIIERANSGIYGYHETPAQFSRIRHREVPPADNWEIRMDKGMSRIYCIYDDNLYRYPALDTDTSFTIRYTINLDAFSARSSQWTNYFAGPAQFNTLWATDGPPVEIERWEHSFVSYAMAQWLRPQNTLTGQQPMWMQYDQEFRSYVEEAMNTKRETTKELVAPYNVSPFSS